MRPNDIEALRQLFATDKVYIAAGKITQLALLSDRSVWNAKVEIFPDNDELIARMTWAQVGPDSGIFGPASLGDLVLVVVAPEIEQAFVIQRLSSTEDTIPAQAGEGHTVVKSLPGKNAHLASDTKILLGKLTDTDPTEPLLLGNVVKSLLSYVLGELTDQADKLSVLSDKLSLHDHIGNMGGPTPLSPAYVTDFTTKKTEFTTKKTNFQGKKDDPVDNNNINSDLSFTEK